jgi:hypothetical protein
MTTDRPYLYRARASDRPDGQKTLLLPPVERRNGVKWADFLGERVIAVLSSQVVYPAKTLLPAYPMWEQDGCLVPVECLRPSAEEFPTFGVVHLNDGGDVFVWDGEGYALHDGRFERAFGLKARWSVHDGSPMTAFGPDGFFFLSNRKLCSVRRGQSPIQHLPSFSNIMSISAGPARAVLLREGDNTLGDLGKLYFPEEGVYLRIEPELFENADPDQIRSLHWASSCGRLVAATPSSLWAVPVERVLGLPRLRSDETGKPRVTPVPSL